MPITTFDSALYILGFQPYFALQIQYRKVIQCLVTVPPTEHVHVMPIDASSVPKPQLKLRKQLIPLWRLHIPSNLAVQFGPLLLSDLKLEHICKNVRLISTPIHEDLRLVDHQ